MSGRSSSWGYIPVRVVLGGVGSLFLVGPIIGWQIPTAAEAGGGACLVVAVLPKLPSRLPFPGTKNGLWLGSKRDLAYNDFVRVEWGRLRPLATFAAGDDWKELLERALEDCYLKWGHLPEGERDRYAMQRIVARAKGRFGLLPASGPPKGVEWKTILGSEPETDQRKKWQEALQDLTITERACLALSVKYGLSLSEVSAVSGDPPDEVGLIVRKVRRMIEGTKDTQL